MSNLPIKFVLYNSFSVFPLRVQMLDDRPVNSSHACITKESFKPLAP